MSLPVVNLDDRKFQDLVDEAKRRIPKHCPEWTNHNLSDPGVALIELFAWMTELTLYQLNQVPDVFYTRMLNLMGFKPFPTTAARVDLTFWLVEPTTHAVVVPAGTRVATAGTLGETRVFSTLSFLVIQQPVLKASLTSTGNKNYLDVMGPLSDEKKPIVCFPRTKPGPDAGEPSTVLDPGDRDDPSAWYIGFENSLAGNAIRLDIEAKVKGLGVDPDRPPLKWEVSHTDGWLPCTVHKDETGGINRDGSIVLLVPQAHERQPLGQQNLYWLRAKLLEPAPGQPTYRESPQVLALGVASLGGSALAEHSDTVRDDILGVSTGQPDQVFVTRRRPVLPRPRLGGEEVIEVVQVGKRTAWQEVPDFRFSTKESTHVVWDDTTGEVRFGPSIRYPDPTLDRQQHGAIPPEGAQIVAKAYRCGGGAAGNVPKGTLTAMRTTIPYVASVENLKPAEGGVDAETVENAKRRGPQSLRSGTRAVTVSDFELLAKQADPAVAHVRCVPPRTSGNPPRTTGDPIRVLVVPKIDKPHDLLELDDLDLPPEMVEGLTTYLDERRILGTTVEIGTPFYQGVTVAALVVARAGREAATVKKRVLDALYGFVNPLTGGVRGEGWPFSADLNAASVIQLIEAIEGVERVDDVLLFGYDLRNKKRLGVGQAQLRLAPDSLFLSASHQVVVRADQ